MKPLSVCDLTATDVNRDARSGDGPRGIPFAGGRGSVSGTTGALGGTVYGRSGNMASTDGSG